MNAAYNNAPNRTYDLTEKEREFLLSILPRVKERAGIKVRAGESGKDCAYRVNREAGDTSPVNCCFIGVLIPPDKYYGRIEGLSADCKEILDAIEAPSKSSEFRRAIFKLQVIHDQHPPHSWEASIAEWEKAVRG